MFVSCQGDLVLVHLLELEEHTLDLDNVDRDRIPAC